MTFTVGMPCPMCGTWFLLETTRRRHMATEIPGFVAESAEKQRAYEVSRRRHRMIYPDFPKEKIEAAGGITR